MKVSQISLFFAVLSSASVDAFAPQPMTFHTRSLVSSSLNLGPGEELTAESIMEQVSFYIVRCVRLHVFEWNR